MPLPERAFPPGFRTEEIETDGATIHVRVGSQGPAVVMLHGFGDTGDVAADVTSVVIPNCGHWLMEEQPAATVSAIRAFLEKKK
jgi:pimeloyl-ACP methyl ester carboxylesterase